MAHHKWWRSTAKLTSDDFGVTMHEMAMRTLETFACHDQVNLGHCAGLEVLLRQAQVAEHYHAASVREADAIKTRKDTKVLSADEVELFLGLDYLKDSVMVCPALAEYVAKEAEKEAAILKQLRKARDEKEGPR